MTSPLFVDAPDQLMSVEQMRSMSGLEFIQGIVEGRHPAPPICRTMNFHFLEATKGRVVCEGTPLFKHYNPIGGVHGGWFGTLIDSCVACAVQTALPQGFGYTTLEYRVNITRPLLEGSEKVHAIGEVLHVGRRTGTAEGKIVGADTGKLYAFGTTTCLVLEL
ncbi:MAG: PaaI family thioesterase [Pseudomonadota bacterium]